MFASVLDDSTKRLLEARYLLDLCENNIHDSSSSDKDVILSNSSKLSLHIVGGYGILAIPTKLPVQSWQSGYGRDAIPSYRLPFIYKDKCEYLLK